MCVFRDPCFGAPPFFLLSVSLLLFLFPMSPPVDVIAAIDQGTQSTRVFLYAVPSMAVVASHQVALTQYYPQPG